LHVKPPWFWVKKKSHVRLPPAIVFSGPLRKYADIRPPFSRSDGIAKHGLFRISLSFHAFSARRFEDRMASPFLQTALFRGPPHRIGPLRLNGKDNHPSAGRK
jgi:hypothetical protein